ncbi:CBS domain-containing protein [Alkalimarinus alittae]|uniref:CBS domain-containing protein n=1 Tax=Alkalimarinus alittae TaxID=2961619 RepID=A0ABY6N1P7_9ALTE|nr:CBS domain-containing protein [Alkalimarinus alittae]UZE95979.1 CBS domain-containing protein [Alkalimarinus alittae]
MTTKVSKYMSPKVISVTSGVGVREAFFLMREKEIRHLPVVDNGKLLGIVSDRALRRPDWVDEAPDISHIYDLNDDLNVGDIMIKNVFCIHTYDTLSKAVKLLLEHKIGAAPVLDKDEQLVGMLSAVDLLQALDDIFSAEKQMKRK